MITVDKYYSIFKIKNIKKISLKELKRRYRILSKKYHPDVGGSKKKFQLIGEAYSHLQGQIELIIENENKKFFNSKHLLF